MGTGDVDPDESGQFKSERTDPIRPALSRARA
jgi:hypothetical protein